MGGTKTLFIIMNFSEITLRTCNFIASEIYCDVKIPWELSRLQWLLWDAEVIATESAKLKSEHLSTALNTIFEWADANPVGYGINWTCGMEVAIRGVVLSVICGILSCRVEDAVADRLASILRAHQIFLMRFPRLVTFREPLSRRLHGRGYSSCCFGQTKQ